MEKSFFTGHHALLTRHSMISATLLATLIVFTPFAQSATPASTSQPDQASVKLTDAGIPVAVAGDDFTLHSSPSGSRNHPLDAGASQNATSFLWEVKEGISKFWLQQQDSYEWVNKAVGQHARALAPTNSEGTATYQLTVTGPKLTPGQTLWITQPTMTIAAALNDGDSGIKSGVLLWRKTPETEWHETALEKKTTHWQTTFVPLANTYYELKLRAHDNADNGSDASNVAPATLYYKSTPPTLGWQDTPLEWLEGEIKVSGRVTDSLPELLNTLIEYRQAGSNGAWENANVTIQPDANGFFTSVVPLADKPERLEIRLAAVDAAGQHVTTSALQANPLFHQTTLESVLKDNDESDGLTPGDGLMLTLVLHATRDINQFTAVFPLPAGLQPDSAQSMPILLDEAQSHYDKTHANTLPGRLNTHWQGTGNQISLLATDNAPDLKQGDKIVLNIPLKVSDNAAGTLSTSVTLGTQNSTWESISVRRQDSVQTRDFPVSRAIATLGLKSPQVYSGGQLRPGAAFHYCLTLRAGRWSMHNPQLSYQLPPDLEKNGTPVLSTVASDTGTAVLVNPEWDGSQNHPQLLASSSALAASKRVVLRIPVKLANNAGHQMESTVIAGAENVKGTIDASHCVLPNWDKDWVTFSACANMLPSFPTAQEDDIATRCD